MFQDITMGYLLEKKLLTTSFNWRVSFSIYSGRRRTTNSWKKTCSSFFKETDQCFHQMNKLFIR